MRRIDDLLIWLTAASGLGLWLWSMAVGPVSAHFFVVLAGMIIGTSLLSLSERKRWKSRQK
ncbi:MAG TPA: hypothetical protein PKD66_12745, partial [Azonexus sp.]|nr:hypothetical protein [Azonexus sp.]